MAPDLGRNPVFSRGLSDTCLSVTSILLAQRKLRVVGAVCQDENIHAVSVAISISVGGVVANIVVSSIFVQLA